MIAPERRKAAYDFRDIVLRTCEMAHPLGAYADPTAAHYVFLDSDGPCALTHALDDDRHLSALSATMPLFSWDEREMAQDYSIAFDGLPDQRPLRMQGGEMPRAIVAHGEGMMQFVVGPVHAGIIEPGRFTFSSEGETIAHLDAQFGYAHRGIEWAIEGLDAIEAAPKIARICGGCSAARSYAYALALERLADFEPPPEIDFARLVIAELERIYNHLADLAASCSGAGYAPGFARGMSLKERAMRICEAASGHRLLFDAIVPGGIGASVGVRPFVIADVVALERDAERYLDALFANDSLVSRWRRAGIVSTADAKAWGAVGPAARGSRGTVDVRMIAPYGAYRMLLAKPAAGSSCDVYARCRVKREELTESFRLLRAALLEFARINVPARALRLQSGIAIGAVEGARGSEVVAVHVDPQGRIERLHVIAASYRNWPIVAHAMKNNIVPDFPLVNKSFNLCYACADR